MTLAPKHILAALALEPEDDLMMAQETVEAACVLAQRLGSELLLMHATIIAAPLDGVAAGVTTQIYDALSLSLESRTQYAKEKLAQFKKNAESSGLRVDTAVVSAEEGVAKTIAHFADNTGIDLIVINSHARHGLKRLALGSVAEHVLRAANIPVLILKTPLAPG